jgi:hypothetical protein
MLRHKTVLIIGAGASSEVRMPLGPALKGQIAKLMEIEPDGWGGLKYSKENYRIFSEIERLEEYKNDRRLIFTAAQQISSGIAFASSIDNFLEIRKDNPHITLLAKAALVHLILEGERNSPLKTVNVGGDQRLKATAIDGTWYQEFTQLLFEKIGVSDIEDALDQLSVIDFNYDRCFEHVLFHALSGLYDIPPPRVSELIKRLKLYHPYGAVGALHIPRKDLSIVAFGEEPDGSYLHLAKGVRTFTEQMTDVALLRKIRDAISQSEALIFLGCAFHAQNMEVLDEPQAGPKLIFGTTYQLSAADNTHVKSRLNTIFSGRGRRSGNVGSSDIKMDNLKCVEFLRQFRRSLSAD